MNSQQKNLQSNYINFAVSALVGLFVNPILFRSLGPAEFGGWRTAQRVLEFATVADGRATQALKWVVAKTPLSASPDLRRRQVGAAVVVWALWLPVLIPVIVVLTLLLPALAPDVESGRNLILCGAILGLATLLRGLLWIPDSVLVGEGIAYRSTRVNTVIIVATSSLLCAAAVVGGGIVWLAVVASLMMLCNAWFTLRQAKRHVSWFGSSLPVRSDIGPLGRLSGLTLVWVGVERIALLSDLVLVALVMGAAGVAQLTFTSYVVQFAVSVSLITTNAFTPALGRHLADNTGRAQDYARRIRLRTMSIWLLLVGAVLIFNRDFVVLWVGPDALLSPVEGVLVILMAAQFMSLRTDAQLIDTTLQVRRKVLIGGIGIACPLIISAFLAVLGVDLAWTLAVIVLLRLPAQFLLSCEVVRLFGALRTTFQSALGYGLVCLAALLSVISDESSPKQEVASLLNVLMLVVVAAGACAILGRREIVDLTTMARHALVRVLSRK